MIVYANRDVYNRTGVLLIPATKGGTVETYLRISALAPALHWILLDARTAHAEKDRQILRYRVRMLDLSDADKAVCLGLLVDALGDEVAA